MKIINSVPYFPNLSDNTHCLQAVLKMILKYFEPDKDYSYEDLDILSDKVPGMWTWATRALINLKKKGYDLVNIEEFDYLSFSRDGEKCLIEKFGYDDAQIQIKNCNLQKEMSDAKEFEEIIGNNFRLPNIIDIKVLIDKDYLVGCNINYEALENKVGYSGHFVLVFGYDDNNLYFHDPGLPAFPNRKVTLEIFNNAWASPSGKNQNLTAFKK